MRIGNRRRKQRENQKRSENFAHFYVSHERTTLRMPAAHYNAMTVPD
jgi:hypothetical protein